MIAAQRFSGLALAALLVGGGSPALAQTAPTAVPPPPPSEVRSLPRDFAVLRWMDKTTARLQTVSLRVGSTETLQGLQVTVRACLERPPEDPPESAVFLDVVERKPGEPSAEVFRGWMFASSPALSAMEHAVYDLWVLDCRTAAEEQEVKAEAEKKGP